VRAQKLTLKRMLFESIQNLIPLVEVGTTDAEQDEF
jgi:hypothetical protein